MLKQIFKTYFVPVAKNHYKNLKFFSSFKDFIDSDCDCYFIKNDTLIEAEVALKRIDVMTYLVNLVKITLELAESQDILRKSLGIVVENDPPAARSRYSVNNWFRKLLNIFK